jgi:hypothetical protein
MLSKYEKDAEKFRDNHPIQECSSSIGKETGKLTFRRLKAKKVGFIVKDTSLTKDGNLCRSESLGFQELSSGERHGKAKDRDVGNMVLNIDNVNEREEIRNKYGNLSPKMQKNEMVQNMKDNIPSSILEALCPKGFKVDKVKRDRIDKVEL